MNPIMTILVNALRHVKAEQENNTMITEIQNKVIKYRKLSFRDLEWFQPEKFKKLDQKRIDKLKTSLINNGFTSPFFVWKNAGKIYILDGHQRTTAIRELIQEEKIKLDKVPCLFLDIKNEAEAIKTVALFNSHYADIDLDIAKEWMGDLDLEQLNLEIDIPKLDFEIPINVEIPDKVQTKSRTKFLKVCPNCQHEFE